MALLYNVTAVDGLFAPGNSLGMTVRFRDDCGWAQVLIRLYEQDIYTGATNLLLTFSVVNVCSNLLRFDLEFM